LESILAQEGDFAREIVDDDDGSTDRSAELVAAWARRRQDLRLIRQENRGPAATTNRCLAAARFPMVKFVDADDLLHPLATALLVKALAAHPQAALAFCDRVDFIDAPPSGCLNSEARVELWLSPLGFVVKNAPFNPTQVLVRRCHALAVGGCSEGDPFAQDYSLALRLAARSPFAHLTQTLCFRRIGLADSVSADQPLELARVTRALGHFLADRHDLPTSLRRLAARRAAGRAWLWRHRHAGAGILSRWSLRRLVALLPPRDTAAFVLASAEAFERPP
jgi:glycosyltransferase involved in cell wall biosynthesis